MCRSSSHRVRAGGAQGRRAAVGARDDSEVGDGGGRWRRAEVAEVTKHAAGEAGCGMSGGAARARGSGEAVSKPSRALDGQKGELPRVKDGGVLCQQAGNRHTLHALRRHSHCISPTRLSKFLAPCVGKPILTSTRHWLARRSLLYKLPRRRRCTIPRPPAPAASPLALPLEARASAAGQSPANRLRPTATERPRRNPLSSPLDFSSHHSNSPRRHQAPWRLQLRTPSPATPARWRSAPASCSAPTCRRTGSESKSRIFQVETNDGNDAKEACHNLVATT